MATAKVETYILTLDKDEAETLLIILQLIGGSPARSRRKFADSVARALETAGVKMYHAYNVETADCDRATGAVRFNAEL